MLTSSLVTAVTDAEEATPENQAARDRNDLLKKIGAVVGVIALGVGVVVYKRRKP